MLKRTAVYRSTDDIDNLRIKIKIEEISQDLENEDHKSKIFHWQQKEYSKFEREFYKDEKNCITDFEKKYHNDVEHIIENYENIFTYINDDIQSFTDEISKYKANSSVLPNESDHFNYKDYLAKMMNSPYDSYYDFECMQIMLDLGEYTSIPRTEYCLCTLKYDKIHKVLQIYPDFNNMEPYYIEIEGNIKRTLQYYVEDVSKKMPLYQLLKEAEILNKITLHQAKLKLQKTGLDFEMPSKNTLNVHLFIEILTAKNFEYNNIYVNYYIDLQRHCSSEVSSLYGTTHTAHSFKTSKLSYFGFPFEVLLKYNNTNDILNSPFIYFEVVSKDSWDRFRSEGLAYLLLPVSNPGTYDYTLRCMRLCSTGPYATLRRYFIGDLGNYSDLTWSSIPKDSKGSVINKYSINTIGTGELKIRVNIVHQSQNVVRNVNECKQKADYFIEEKLNTGSLFKSIAQVVEAFQEAKKRMIETRKNIQIHI